MAFQIEVKPEDIDAYLKDAIIKSAVGKTFGETMTKIMSGYDNPIEKEMKNIVQKMTCEVLENNYKDKIKLMCINSIEKIVTDDLIETVVDETVKKMIRRDY